jgi:hypothetical protein
LQGKYVEKISLQLGVKISDCKMIKVCPNAKNFSEEARKQQPDPTGKTGMPRYYSGMTPTRLDIQ